ncbi:MAG: hypothetical protein LBT11_02825 [Treponema sp.]|nr:hypothetical protein [Treponema sp.]
MRKEKTLMVFLLILAPVLYAQSSEIWYSKMPAKAVLSSDGKLMRIGEKEYHVYNAFDPIAPTGGERVIGFAGVLDYYLWLFISNNIFTMARIDMEFNIFYYDEHTGEFTSPKGEVFP